MNCRIVVWRVAGRGNVEVVRAEDIVERGRLTSKKGGGDARMASVYITRCSIRIHPSQAFLFGTYPPLTNDKAIKKSDVVCQVRVSGITKFIDLRQIATGTFKG